VEGSQHVCAFFNSREEEYSVLHPFFQEGLAQSEKAFYIVDPDEREKHLSRLDRVGVDTRELQQKGQLEVLPWQKAHLSGGHFDGEDMLKRLDSTFTEIAAQGYPMTRIWANMEWALLGPTDTEQLVEYEAKFNYISIKHLSQVVVCVYDVSEFGGDLAFEVMRVHPMLIVGGVLHKNPFYIHPDTFLRERIQA